MQSFNAPSGRSSILMKGLFFVSLLACFSLAVGFYFLYRGNTTGEVKDILIPRGATLAKVSELLYENEVIEHPVLFKLFLRITGGNTKVRAGEFRFKTHMNLLSALTVVYHDEEIIHQVTIPEGWTAVQIAEILESAKLGKKERFIELTLNESAAKRYGIKAPSLEGFLYPDTYGFSRIDGEEKIIDHMIQHFLKIFEKELKAEASEKGYTMEKLATFASIVEKETGNANERPLVASVFHNRIKKGMRLQSDPTTIYGIKNYNGNITKADLKRPTPYNTYTIFGLPPGPIANPGIHAMKAVLNPAQTDYLYFVANREGAHIFSKTYEEHARFVSGYQIKPALEERAKKRNVNSTRRPR